MADQQDYLVSVVIPTIDRGPAIRETVESILRNDYQNRELVVVDQSRDDLTEQCLRPYLGSPEVCYLRAPREGVALSRNLGAHHGKGTLIAFTDDDCVVPPTWLRDVVRGFCADDRIAMLYGNVLAGPHRRSLGFVQAYIRREPFLATSAFEKHRVEGIGACMALRKRVWEQLGGFDLALGAGSTFRSAEETDLALRALLAGFFVYETPEISVIHNGFRTWQARPHVIHNYLYGLGAMSAKHLRCLNWPILRLLAHLAFRWAFAEPVADLGGRPPRLMRLQAYASGMISGALTQIDRNRVLYRPYAEHPAWSLQQRQLPDRPSPSSEFSMGQGE